MDLDPIIEKILEDNSKQVKKTNQVIIQVEPKEVDLTPLFEKLKAHSSK